MFVSHSRGTACCARPCRCSGGSLDPFPFAALACPVPPTVIPNPLALSANGDRLRSEPGRLKVQRRETYATQSGSLTRSHSSFARGVPSPPWKSIDLHHADDHSPGPHHLGRSPGSGGIHAVLDGLSGFCRCLAMVRHTETRQEYLLAVPGLDPVRRCRDCWRAFLRVMRHSPALAAIADRNHGPSCRVTRVYVSWRKLEE